MEKTFVSQFTDRLKTFPCYVNFVVGLIFRWFKSNQSVSSVNLQKKEKYFFLHWMAAFANKCSKNVRKQSLQKMRNVNLSRSNRRLQQPKALSSLIGFILVICKFDITSAMIYEKQCDGIQETRLSKKQSSLFSIHSESDNKNF